MKNKFRKSHRIYTLMIITTCCILLAACSTNKFSSWDEKARFIENNLPRKNAFPPWESRTLTEAMKQYEVPGISIAVFDNNKPVWASGYGEMEKGSANPVTPETRFPALGVSSMASRFMALDFVEKGKIAWDEDVNNYLVFWKLPENNWTQTGSVTLEALIKFNSAGLVHFPIKGYATDETLPTLEDILDGKAPAKNPPVRVMSQPGVFRNEAWGNLPLVSYIVLQKLLEDVSGEPFPQLAHKLLLAPLGMKNSTFAQPLPWELVPFAASGHDSQGTIQGKRRVFPETAGRGLWCTPSDLSLFFIESSRIAQGAQQGIISRKSLGKIMNFTRSCHYLSSSGQGFTCAFRYNPSRGQGVVIMTNNGWAGTLTEEFMHTVFAVNGWKWCRSPLRESIFSGFLVVISMILLAAAIFFGGLLLFLRRGKRKII